MSEAIRNDADAAATNAAGEIKSGFVRATDGRIFWRDVDCSTGRARTMGLSRFGVWNLPQSEAHERSFVAATPEEIEAFHADVLQCHLMEEQALLEKIERSRQVAAQWDERFRAARGS